MAKVARAMELGKVFRPEVGRAARCGASFLNAMSVRLSISRSTGAACKRTAKS
jgi:hypothetical protein